METIKIYNKPTLEERETHLNYDPIDDVWVADSNIPKHFRKFLKQGWTPIRQYVYEDGTVCAMLLKGPERAITVRNVKKKQMSEKQLSNLLQDDDE
jgi:hypothetical protein